MMNLDDLKIVKLREIHAEAIATLESETMLNPRNRQEIRDAIYEGSKGFVAIIGQTLVGHIEFNEHASTKGVTIVLSSFSVTVPLQRHRIGNELMRKVIEVVDDPTNKVTQAKAFIRNQLDDSVGRFYWVHGFIRRKIHRDMFGKEDGIEYVYYPNGYTCRGRVTPLHILNQLPNN